MWPRRLALALAAPAAAASGHLARAATRSIATAATLTIARADRARSYVPIVRHHQQPGVVVDMVHRVWCGCGRPRSFHSHAGGRLMADVPPSPTAAAAAAATETAASTASASPPLPFAIVGSGPSAFYTAKYLLRELGGVGGGGGVRVDMFERLPVPYGLVRFGVAPDHPDVKAVTNDFAQVTNDSRFRYYGNVAVGGDLVSVSELRRHYAGVILAYGAASERQLEIPGADLRGIHTSRQFVNWYNAHPEHADVEATAKATAEAEANQQQGKSEDVKDPGSSSYFHLDRVRNVVIVGQGNVAIDCARILLSPVGRLGPTDISTRALDELTHSTVEAVHMVGRRGVVQSAFSIGEVREMATAVEGVRVVIDPKEFELGENPASLVEVAESRPKKRKHELMKQIVAGTLPSIVHSTTTTPATTTGTPKDLHLRFLLNPIRFLPSPTDPTRVGAIVLERTRLEGSPDHQEAIATGETITIETELVLTSIGYRSLPLPDVPFDTRRHIVPSLHGRVLTGPLATKPATSAAAAPLETNASGVPPPSTPTSSSSIPGLYVSGWLKRGPSGIIATNIMDARDTVKSIVQDIREGVIGPPEIGAPLGLLSSDSLRKHGIVDRVAWARIDAHEQARGLERGKPRVKLIGKAKMLEVAHGKKQQ